METTEDIWKDVTRDRGIPEVTVRWVSNNIDRVRLVDVREPAELIGALGKIEDAESVPLGSVGYALDEWDKGAPIVLVCRSGGRSARAAQYLEQSGFRYVASMDGGMLTWNEQGLPLEGAVAASFGE